MKAKLRRFVDFIVRNGAGLLWALLVITSDCGLVVKRKVRRLFRRRVDQLK